MEKKEDGKDRTTQKKSDTTHTHGNTDLGKYQLVTRLFTLSWIEKGQNTREKLQKKK